MQQIRSDRKVLQLAKKFSGGIFFQLINLIILAKWACTSLWTCSSSLRHWSYMRELPSSHAAASTFKWCARKRNLLYFFFFLGGVTATAPSRDLTDIKKKRREGSSRGESKRKLLKETQNQRKETRKKKKNQSRVQS